jgi:dienelactone hydrolase
VVYDGGTCAEAGRNHPASEARSPELSQARRVEEWARPCTSRSSTEVTWSACMTSSLVTTREPGGSRVGSGTRRAVPGGQQPLVLFAHYSGGSRLSSTFLCTHLASHGYAVAALDHSEVLVPEPARHEQETPEERAARIEAVVAARVPDLRFLLAHLLDEPTPGLPVSLDADRVALVGHSFGGWTVLATTEVEPPIRAVVALAAAGRAQPRPGLLPVTLTFAWDRDVPALYLVGEYDLPVPPRTSGSCASAPRRRSGCSSCAAPTISTSWTMSRRPTKPCAR